MARNTTTSPGLKHDPLWYRKAVFYEVLVRAFADSNGSGSGDFTALWAGQGFPMGQVMSAGELTRVLAKEALDRMTR